MIRAPHIMHKARMRPGANYPLGATWDGHGVNFALFSAHAESVELCLFDTDGVHEIERITLPEYTDEVWHGRLPSARPGMLYGYRVHGAYDPAHGHRFNAAKLLIDPYARALHGTLKWGDAHFGYRVGGAREDLVIDRRNNAHDMPKCVVVNPSFGWSGEQRPQTALSDSFIYEAHVGGLTMTRTDIPKTQRGRFAALADPHMIRHYKDIGITALELLPVHARIDDRRLVDLGLVNYWGYNTIAFFAPDPCYMTAGDIDEFKTMVLRLHDAGIEVFLDVVYNHTAEGDHRGPTLSLRGIDNSSYYWLRDDAPRFYEDFTGCGNTLNLRHPRVIQMVLDSLRYWVTEMHVDGFRFDLAPTLAREDNGFDIHSGFLDAVRQDPALAHVKLIAEPWDLGPNGYQLGRFPPGWSEWNDQFRDAVRRFWKGDGDLIGDMANRLSGSADRFNHRGRRPWSSVNFVTAHDGFTLDDLVSYDGKHNLANGEDNRDGTNENNSWNCGVEGATNDPTIHDLRQRQKRNMIASLLVAQGVPMLLAGDEIGNSQNGNNNAYCQDNSIGWLDWSPARIKAFGIMPFLQRMVALRRAHPVLRQRRFLTGRPMANDFPDVLWLTPQGRPAMDEDWNFPQAQCLAYVLNGHQPERADHMRPGACAHLLFFLNALHEDFSFVAPLNYDVTWKPMIDTAATDGKPQAGLLKSGDTYTLTNRSMVILASCLGEKRTHPV